MSSEDDVRNLIGILYRRLQKLEEQKAKQGTGANPETLIEIEDIKREIGKLQTELSQFQQSSRVRPIPILFAVVAMTRDEAAILDSEKIFDDEMVPPGERKYWRELKDALAAHDVNDLISCYGDHRHEWKPLMLNQRPIQDIIENVTDKLNKSHRLGLQPIYPKLLSDFLSSSDKDRLLAWETLEEQGGILIVDAISLYHPIFRRTVLDSQLIGSNKRIAVIVIPPLSADRINDILEKKAYTYYLKRAFARYTTDHLNPCYEFYVFNLHILRRRLSSIFQHIIGNPGLNQRQRDAIHNQMGAPQGMGSWISRGGV